MNSEPSEEPNKPDDQSLPVFPAHLIPSSIKKSARREFFDCEMQTDEDVEYLLELLYRQPEVATFSFHPQGQPMNARLLAAEKLGHLRVLETQSYWYEHPNYPNNFVRVPNPEPEFDWQKELRANGQMLFRNELALTTQERRQREIRDTAKAIAAASPTPAPPETRWERVEHAYHRRPALFWLIAVAITVLGTALGISVTL